MNSVRSAPPPVFETFYTNNIFTWLTLHFCTSAPWFLKHFTLQIPLISSQVTNTGKSPPNLFNQNLEYVHLSPHPQPSFVNSNPPSVTAILPFWKFCSWNEFGIDESFYIYNNILHNLNSPSNFISPWFAGVTNEFCM